MNLYRAPVFLAAGFLLSGGNALADDSLWLNVKAGTLGIGVEGIWHPERFLPPYAERFVEEFVVFARRSNPGRDITRRAPPIPRPKEAAEPRAPVRATRR
jgi:hypothetical protein